MGHCRVSLNLWSGHLQRGKKAPMELGLHPPGNFSQINKQPTQLLLYQRPWQRGEALSEEAGGQGKEAVWTRP